MISISPSEVTHAYDWYKRRHQIDLEPPYQRRGGLWSRYAKGYLIDSMVNGFDVPKLYVADLALLPDTLRSKSCTHAVIDGKQRLETLFEWFSGDLHLNGDFVYLEDHSVAAAGLNSRELSANYPEIAARVELFRLAVMNVAADNQEQINQLFIRLNRSQPLTGAETRNAMEGAVPDVLRRLASHRFFTDRVRFSVKRGADLNTAAKILLLEFTGEFVDVKKRRLDVFVKTIADEAALAGAEPADLAEAAKGVEEVFDDLANVFVTNDALLATQGQIPVYYWLVREVGAAHDLRAFIADFELQRELNRQTVAEQGTSGAIDLELLQYDQFNRSVNDQHSLRGRYEILKRRFLEATG